MHKIVTVDASDAAREEEETHGKFSEVELFFTTPRNIDNTAARQTEQLVDAVAQFFRDNPFVGVAKLA